MKYTIGPTGVFGMARIDEAIKKKISLLPMQEIDINGYSISEVNKFKFPANKHDFQVEIQAPLYDTDGEIVIMINLVTSVLVDSFAISEDDEWNNTVELFFQVFQQSRIAFLSECRFHFNFLNHISISNKYPFEGLKKLDFDFA